MPIIILGEKYNTELIKWIDFFPSSANRIMGKQPCTKSQFNKTIFKKKFLYTVMTKNYSNKKCAKCSNGSYISILLVFTSRKSYFIKWHRYLSEETKLNQGKQFQGSVAFIIHWIWGMIFGQLANFWLSVSSLMKFSYYSIYSF